MNLFTHARARSPFSPSLLQRRLEGVMALMRHADMGEPFPVNLPGLFSRSILSRCVLKSTFLETTGGLIKGAPYPKKFAKGTLS